MDRVVYMQEKYQLVLLLATLELGFHVSDPGATHDLKADSDPTVH